MGSTASDNSAKMNCLLEVVRLECEEGVVPGQSISCTPEWKGLVDSEPLTQMSAERLGSPVTSNPVAVHEEQKPEEQGVTQANLEAVLPAQELSQHSHKQLSQQQSEKPSTVLPSQPASEKPNPAAPSLQAHGRACSSKQLPGGPCESCSATESPQWRRPDPARMLLCNRCGIHYSRYKKLPGKKVQAGHECNSAATQQYHIGGAAPPSGMQRVLEAPSGYQMYHQQYQHVPAAVDAAGRAQYYSPGIMIPRNAARNVPHLASASLPPRLAGGNILVNANDRVLNQDFGQGAVEYILNHGNSLDFRPVRRDLPSSVGCQSSIPMQQVFPSDLQHQPAVLATLGKRISSEVDEEDVDPGVGKKAALQRKLQRLFSSNGTMPVSNSHSRGYDSQNELSATASPTQESQLEYTQDIRAAHAHVDSRDGTYSAHPQVLIPAAPELLRFTQHQHVGTDYTHEPSHPASEVGGGQKQQHYVYKNGVLLGLDGSPADAAAYNSVLSSLMQQRHALVSGVSKERMHGPVIAGRPPMPAHPPFLFRVGAETH